MQPVDMNQKGFCNVLIEWGKTHTHSPQITSYLKRLEEYCKPFIHDNRLEDFLSHSIEELKKQVDTAVSILSDTELVTSTEDTPLWHEAESSLITLDRVNYLMDAIHFLIAPYRDAVYKKSIHKLDEIFSFITSWLEEGAVSPLRFVVLNDTRRECLSQIPEETRYRFPWYENYSDYDENILETIILYFDDFLSKKWKKLAKKIPVEHLVEIWHELKRDVNLFSLVKRESALQKKLFKAVSVPSSLKLLGLSSDETSDAILPECVENAGVIWVCVSLLHDAILEIFSEAEKIYWTFLPALCGPSLNGKQRLEFLDTVENMISKIDIMEIARDKGELLKTLKLWFEGKIEDSYLIKISFDTWNKLIEEKASRMPTREVDAAPDELWKAINNLVKKEIPIQVSERIIRFESLETMREKRKSHKQSEFYNIFLHKVAANAGKEETGTEELKVEKNHIYFSLLPYDRGAYPIIPPPEEVSGCTAVKEYKKLWDVLGNIKGDSCYAGGICLKEDWQIKEIPIQPIKRRIFERIESKEGFRNAVIVISNERARIEEFIKIFSKSFDWTEREINEFNVIVLDIWLEKSS